MPWRSRREPEPEPTEIDRIIRANVALASRLRGEQREHLIHLTDVLLRTKRWESVDGLALTDEVRVTIAANASIPILSFDEWPYRLVRSIIVRPSSATSTGLRSGPATGTVTDETIDIIGEATPNSGPVAISWDAAHFDSRHPSRGRNVVIHEFAHKIDMADGFADGVPPLRGAALTNWQQILTDEYDGIDAHSSDHVLDPYAWASPAEFFAVATETFFCVPAQLVAAKPALYAALSSLFQQDPAGSADPPREEVH